MLKTIRLYFVVALNIQTAPVVGWTVSPQNLWSRLFENTVFADLILVKDLEMNSSWIIRWTLNPMASVLIRDTQKRDAERGEGHVNMKAEIGVMQPQAKGP